jgi:hypothetical protein
MFWEDGYLKRQTFSGTTYYMYMYMFAILVKKQNVEEPKPAFDCDTYMALSVAVTVLLNMVNLHD